jgi:hypothetical protein
MIDTTQILLIAVITVLTVILTVIGIQLIYILKELRKTVDKVNKILDDTAIVSENIAKPVAGISSLLTGLKAGVDIANLFKTKRTEKSHQHEK